MKGEPRLNQPRLSVLAPANNPHGRACQTTVLVSEEVSLPGLNGLDCGATKVHGLVCPTCVQ